MSMDSVILLDGRGHRRLIRLGEGMLKVEGLGVLDAARLASSVGKVVSVAGRKFLVMIPSTQDRIESIQRGAQIVVAKDSASIVQRCDIGAGDTVIEGGTGSAALTIALAKAVSPAGRVISYEIREDFAEISRKNLAAAGYAGFTEVRLADIAKGIAEREVKAVILDLPEPWLAVNASWDALATCGHLATYSPTMEQVKETVRAIRGKPFVDVRTTEILEREIEVQETGVRPAFAALGHTGYITTARKVLENI